MEEKNIFEELNIMLTYSEERAEELNRLFDEDKMSAEEWEKQLMWEKGYQHAIKTILRKNGG